MTNFFQSYTNLLELKPIKILDLIGVRSVWMNVQ